MIISPISAMVKGLPDRVSEPDGNNITCDHVMNAFFCWQALHNYRIT